MKYVIATLISIMLLVAVPSGFAQVHKYIQEQENVRHVAANLTMHLAKKGTLQPANIQSIVSSFLQDEILKKALPIDSDKVTIIITRENGFSDEELTAYDTFKVVVHYPRPRLIAWLDVVPDLNMELYGTMEPVPHYKEGT
ncbi:hypothetical protein [Brevibacillus sp. SYSU BS000544]|uniref:hypothetical protein n=1 Tax=Brevibacillus sp. SYSU BS000544 TaxID=3416443 RepID=UPI003CE54F1D